MAAIVANEAKQILFQSSLADVVRSLRNSKKSEGETIQEALNELKAELSSTVQHVKITAVLKLSYFHMLGYNGEHGAFNVIEVMADPQFGNKRAGYIAAAMTFNENTPVLPLCTALVKRDLASQNQYEVGLGLYFLSCVCSPDLARDLVSDVVGLLSHSRAYVRKKAVLCLYKLFLHFPDALRLTYPMLREKIEDGSANTDSDPGVRGAVVTILCELARRNPQNFLSLVVPFFALLSSVHNNWTLIKVIKVFGHFSPHEPRLGKKLVDPITNLITTTHAKSVQYECIFAVANGMSKVAGLVKTAVDKMKIFVEDHDQNLKYLGLDAMSRLMRENPKLLTDQRETLLVCLKDHDVAIRGKALQLMSGIVTKKTLVDTVNNMFDNAVPTPSDEDWTNTVIRTIVETVSVDDYANVQDFEWYCAVLLDLAQLPITHFEHGALLEREFINICLRVPAVRFFAVDSLAALLHNSNVVHADPSKSTHWRILCAAAFLAGEFPQWLPSKKATCLHLLQDRIMMLPSELQGICVTAAGKLRDYLVHPLERHLHMDAGEEDNAIPADSTVLGDVAPLFALDPPVLVGKARHIGIKGGLYLFLRSPHPDVVERALVVQQVCSFTEPTDHRFFLSELQPVLDDAQAAITFPDTIDLETPFCDTLPHLIRDSDDDDAGDSDSDASEADSPTARKSGAVREADYKKMLVTEKERRVRMDDYYIKEARGGSAPIDDNELPPVVELEAAIPGTARANRRTAAHKSHTITREFSKPANYVSPKQPSRNASVEQEDEATVRLRNVNLAKPVGKDEALPTIKPYVRVDPQAAAAADATSSDAAALETKRLAASGRFQVVDVLQDGPLHATIQVIDAKMHKDGRITLTVAVTVANSGDGHSLSDVVMAVGPTEARKPVTFIDAESNTKANISVAPKVKAGSQATVEASLCFQSIPESFVDGVPLVVTAGFGKKTITGNGALPLLCKYFMKEIDAAVPLDYNGVVNPLLESAGCVSASIPLTKKFDGAKLLEAFHAQLRLQVISVFRDCVVLCGQVICRKSSATQSYLSVLLKEEAAESGGGRQLTVVVRGNSGAHIEGVINEVSVLLDA